MTAAHETYPVSGALGGRSAAAVGAIPYRPDIDGLRAIAVSSVVFYHVDERWLPGGFTGVDIFFVISGYLIGGQIYREAREHRFRFAAFYARRLRRILPALLVLLIVLMALGTMLLTPIELRELGKETVASAAGLANVLFYGGGGYFTPSSELMPLLMTWSLGVEEQFYLLFPFVLLLLIKTNSRSSVEGVLIILSVLAFFGSVYLTRVNQPAAFYLLPTRAWELGLGAILAIRESRHGPLASRPLSEIGAAAGLVAIFASLFLYRPDYAFPGLFALLPVIGTTVLLAAGRSLASRRILSVAPLTFLGLVSYSWYLWHWPLIYFDRLLGGERGGLPGALLILGSLGMAVLSWRFVERPLRRRVLPEGQVILRYGGAVLVVGSLGLALYLSEGWPARLAPAGKLMAEQAIAARNDPCLATFGERALIENDRCLPAAVTGEGKLILIGDSHASSAEAGFRRLSAANGFAYGQMTKSSCPPLAGYSGKLPERPAHWHECITYQRAVYRYLERHPEVGVVVLAGYWASGMRVTSSDDAAGPAVPLYQALIGTVDRLQAMGKNVVLMQDVPKFGFDPYNRVLGDFLPLRRWLQGAAGDPGETGASAELLPDPSRAILSAVAAARPEVRVIDPMATLCKADACAYRAPAQLYYYDFQHLTARGALAAIPADSLRN